MKKHLHNSLRALFLSLAVLLSLPMLAVEVEIDGINYELNADAKQATVIAKSSGEYSGSIVIPESVEHESAAYSVASIGDDAFRDCSGLTSVSIGNSVTSIGNQAFYSCFGLTSVHISDIAAWCNINFGDNPLHYAHHLYLNGEEVKDLVIPNSVTSIGNDAFAGCWGLTSVTIPNSVTSIGDFAFDSCSGLTSVSIGNSVTSIGNDAFAGCWGLTSVTIPNSVKSIGNSAFWDCSGLTSITIPNSVESIGNRAFAYCSALTSVAIPNSVMSIGEYAFSDCSVLTSVTIPNSVTRIEANTFSGCSGLTSVTIPNSVTSIGDRAFYDCDGLTSVTIPNSVTSIGHMAFDNCFGLTAVHISDIAAWYNIDFESSSANPLSYAHHLYLNGEEVKDLVIPNSVTSIGNHVFEGCSGLTSVTIPNSVTNIGSFAFRSCSGLTSVTIPNSVESIGDFAFDGCSGLTSVTIPNSVTSIGSSAFVGCSGLTSVTIPNSVTSIGLGTFAGCSGLTSVTIPNSVTSIGAYAFVSCSSLTSVTIPNSVTSIGSRAFADCTELLDVYCYAENVPSTESNAFDGSDPEYATLHVPAASIDSYKSTAPWSGFGTITSISGTVTLTDGEEFENIIEQEVATLTYTRTLSKTNTWNALYVPFEIPMTAEFCQNYDVAYFNDVHCYDNYVGEKEDGVFGQDGVIDGMDMEVLKAQEGSVLNANYPYLIRAKNTDALNMNIEVEDATLYSAKETTISCSSVFMRFDVTGIYTTQTAGELKGEYDVYAISGGGWKQALNANQQLKPFRLYLKLTSIDGSPVKATEGAMSRINIRVQGEDTETGIDELKTENGNVKTDIYDLSGRRVQKAQKGIFIQNGKKVIM